MTHDRWWTRRTLVRLGAAVTLAATVAVSGAAPTGARAASPALPLGVGGLMEIRTAEQLTTGVQLITIVRGFTPAPADQILTTNQGPWRLHVLSIDPRTARGHLAATYGADLAQVERTTGLVSSAGALAGVNSGFFTFSKNPKFPGDPVGLGLYRGTVLSEPAAVKPEVDLVVNAKTNKVTIGRLTWSGAVTNRRTDKSLKLEFLDHPPVIPKSCAKLKDSTQCKKSGDVVYFRPQFGPTPTGYGVEVVLDKSGCVVRSQKKRGATLTAGQTSIQATGSQTRTLQSLTKKGCLSAKITLLDENKKKVSVTAGSYGVAGRYRLTRNGKVVVPAGSGAFFARNPRTLAGTTGDGRILLVTIDGRSANSVGTTLAETATVAQSLGMTNSLNLDGGGSTTMSVAGMLVNQPSGSSERAVGDALVYIDRPWS